MCSDGSACVYNITMLSLVLWKTSFSSSHLTNVIGTGNTFKPKKD